MKKQPSDESQGVFPRLTSASCRTAACGWLWRWRSWWRRRTCPTWTETSTSTVWWWSTEEPPTSGRESPAEEENNTLLYFVITDSPAALAWSFFPSCSWRFLIDCTHSKTFWGTLFPPFYTLVHQSWLEVLRRRQRGALSHLSEQHRRCRQIHVTVWRL